MPLFMIERRFAEVIHRAAERAGLPADVVVEVSAMPQPDGSLSPI